ncbi:retrovirus-related pol polyprotein from transposon TNT 1-94 [Tanacetum coccineum]
MHSRFEMSLMGEMKFFLGLQIHQSPKGIFINQAKYALEILKKHNMDNCHSIGTPLATKPKLDVDLSGEPVDQSDYRSKIGSLMYLASSRPDLVQAVCYCARYQARPTQKSTSRSTSGSLVVNSVSWMSKKQKCTAMSSAEAEYVALSASCAQTVYQLADMFTKALLRIALKYLVRMDGIQFVNVHRPTNLLRLYHHTTNGHQFTMLNRHKNWLVHKQTACGKDFSNPFMVDNLPKIVGFSTHLASLVKSWLVQDQTVLALASPKANELTIPEQTATGKGTSNPFMAGSLPKTTKPT